MNNYFYFSSDLSLVAALSLWYPIESVDKSNGRRVTFSFERTPELLESVAAYYRGELQIDPRVFFDHLKAVKTRLYAQD